MSRRGGEMLRFFLCALIVSSAFVIPCSCQTLTSRVTSDCRQLVGSGSWCSIALERRSGSITVEVNSLTVDSQNGFRPRNAYTLWFGTKGQSGFNQLYNIWGFSPANMPQLPHRIVIPDQFTSNGKCPASGQVPGTCAPYPGELPNNNTCRLIFPTDCHSFDSGRCRGLYNAHTDKDIFVVFKSHRRWTPKKYNSDNNNQLTTFNGGCTSQTIMHEKVGCPSGDHTCLDVARVDWPRATLTRSTDSVTIELDSMARFNPPSIQGPRHAFTLWFGTKSQSGPNQLYNAWGFSPADPNKPPLPVRIVIPDRVHAGGRCANVAGLLSTDQCRDYPGMVPSNPCGLIFPVGCYSFDAATCRGLNDAQTDHGMFLVFKDHGVWDPNTYSNSNNDQTWTFNGGCTPETIRDDIEKDECPAGNNDCIDIVRFDWS